LTAGGRLLPGFGFRIATNNRIFSDLRMGVQLLHPHSWFGKHWYF